MASHLCKCIDARGRITTAWFRDTDTDALLSAAKERGFTLVSVIKTTDTGHDSHRGKRPLSHKLMLEFSLSLRSLLHGGITVREALVIQKKVTPYPRLKDLITATVKAIDNGDSFHDALAARRAGFSPVYLGLIKAGEETGDLVQVLDALIVQMKRSKKIREKLISAAIYPLFVLSALCAGLLLLFLIVLPGIAESFSHMSMGLKLQDLSRTAFRSGVRIGIGAGVIFVSAIVILTASRSRNPRFAPLSRIIDRITLKIPVLGRLQLDSQMFTLSSSMTSLLVQGMSMEEAIGLSSSAVSNSWLKANLLGVKSGIEKGDSLYDAMSGASAIPEYVKGWIGVGEQTAAMGQVFDQLKNFYGDRLDDSIDRVTAAVEPVLIVSVGIVIVYVLYAFIIPIFGIFTNIL